MEHDNNELIRFRIVAQKLKVVRPTRAAAVATTKVISVSLSYVSTVLPLCDSKSDARMSLICNPCQGHTAGATSSIPVPSAISEARRRQRAYSCTDQSAEPVSSNGLNSLIPGRRKSFSFPVGRREVMPIAIAALSAAGHLEAFG